MRIGVTGYGVVGQATADVMRRLDHAVFVHDVSPERLEEATARGLGVRQTADRIEVDFICVPEVQLEAALAELPASDIAVIRSTVPPGTTDRLVEEFARPLAYIPEFLREANARWDAMNPSFVLIGSRDEKRSGALAELFAPLMAQVVQVTPPVAEMVKLTLNAYLHTLISFWNEVHLVCEQAGLPSHLVGKICALDPRVVPYGATLHGEAVGGSCLPKDLDQLIAFAKSVECTPELLEAVQQVNEKLIGRTPRAAHLDSGQGLLIGDGPVPLRW